MLLVVTYGTSELLQSDGSELCSAGRAVTPDPVFVQNLNEVYFGIIYQARIPITHTRSCTTMLPFPFTNISHSLCLTAVMQSTRQRLLSVSMGGLKQLF